MTPERPSRLIDACIGKRVEQWLMDQGYDVTAIRTIDPRMKDEKVLELAGAESVCFCRWIRISENSCIDPDLIITES